MSFIARLQGCLNCKINQCIHHIHRIKEKYVWYVNRCWKGIDDYIQAHLGGKNTSIKPVIIELLKLIKDVNKHPRANIILNAFPLRLGTRQDALSITFSHHCSGYILQVSMAIKKTKRPRYFWGRNEILLFHNLESLCHVMVLNMFVVWFLT